MKNVLLTTTALVAFAGAATAADFSVSGDAEVFIDLTTSGSEYVDGSGGLDFTIVQELNNGATLTAETGFDVILGTSSVTWNAWPTMTLATSYGTIAAGGIDNVNLESFAEVAGMTLVEVDFGATAHHISATSTVGGLAVAASTDYNLADVAFNASGSTGAVDFAVFYETGIMGLNASTSVGGMDLTFAYADRTAPAETSFGVGVGYAVSSTVSVAGSYASNTTGVDQIAVGVAYDDGSISAAADYDVDASVLDLEAGYTTEIQAGTTVTVGLTVADATGLATVGYSVDVAYVAGDLGVYAGYDDVSGTYIGANYDLGNGVNAWAYMADYVEAGPLEWNAQTRVGITAEF